MTSPIRSHTKSRIPFWAAGRIFFLACLLLSVTVPGAAAAPPPADPGAAQGSPAQVTPYLLIENVGQYAAGARFLLRQGDQRLWLTDDALWLIVPDPASAGPGRQGRHSPETAAASRTGTAFRFSFPGSDPAATPEPYGRVPAHISYLMGSDPARWQRDVPVWSGVRYRDLFPGIDLVIGGDAAGLVPWRLEARSGADLSAVALRIEGADAVTADAGQLRLEAGGRAITVAPPEWSQAGQARRVGSALVPKAGTAAFGISPASQQQAEQVSMPDAAGITAPGDLIYSRFLGGASPDAGYAVAVDYQGNAYVTGKTDSSDFPTQPGSYDLSYNGSTDAFVVKFNATGTALLYATFLGGSALDEGAGIAVNGDLAYVVGETRSANFPGTTGSAGENDIFVAALNATGSGLRYVSLLGGAGFDYGYGIAVDETNTYVVGSSTSSNLPLAAGCATSTNRNLVVARFGPLGAHAYTTCFGGSDLEDGFAIAVLNGVAYVTGVSYSADFPAAPPGGWPGGGDIVLATVNANGTLGSSTLIGGSGAESGNGIATDGSGNIYIIGTTSSLDFPITAGSWGGGSTDAVVARTSPALTVNFAVYLGGNGDDEGYAIASDTVQGLYVAGTTTSTNLPLPTGAYDASYNGGLDVFVARMHLSSAAANKVTYATYLGGTSDDLNYGIATDGGGNAFVNGSTTSSDFPTTVGAPWAGWDDAFLAKLKVSSPPTAPAVTIAAAANKADAVLTWSSVAGASKYQVFRSSAPYFKPGDWSSSLPLAEPITSSHTDTGALTPVNAYFYVVKAVSAAPEAGASSNRVGKFTFQLTPGTN